MRKDLLVKVIGIILSGAVVVAGAATGITGSLSGGSVGSSEQQSELESLREKGESVADALYSVEEGCDSLTGCDSAKYVIREDGSDGNISDSASSYSEESTYDTQMSMGGGTDVNAVVSSVNNAIDTGVLSNSESEPVENASVRETESTPSDGIINEDETSSSTDLTPEQRKYTIPAHVARRPASGNLAKEAFDLINEYRVSNGVAALAWSEADAKVATIRAEEIASDFSHSSVSGANEGYGENIAVTYGGTASEVVNAWIGSAGHRANILRKSYASAGLAVYKVGGAYYWSNNFSTSGKTPKEGDEGTTTEQLEDGTKITTDEEGNISIVAGDPKLDANGWTVRSYPLQIEIQEKVVPIYETKQIEVPHGTPGTEGYYIEIIIEENKDKKIGERKNYSIYSKIWVELHLQASSYATCAETRQEAEQEECTLENLKFTYMDNGRMVKAHFTNGEVDELRFV